MFPKENYKVQPDSKKWEKIIEDGGAAAPYSPREYKGTDKKDDTVPFLNYSEWNPDLYGGCEMWRGKHPDGKITATGYLKCGSAYELRVTDIPQVPDK